MNGNIDILATAYAKYQLDWMRAQGYSLADLFNILDKMWDEDISFPYSSEDYSPSYYFDNFETDRGFGGSLWVCLDEFKHAEFLDESYMEYLLTEEEFAAYKNYLKEHND